MITAYPAADLAGTRVRPSARRSQTSSVFATRRCRIVRPGVVRVHRGRAQSIEANRLAAFTRTEPITNATKTVEKRQRHLAHRMATHLIAAFQHRTARPQWLLRRRHRRIDVLGALGG